MRHGRMDEAGRFYRKALKRQGENAESLAAMGLWTLEQGDQKEARTWLQAGRGPRQGRGSGGAAAARLGPET